MKHAILSVLFIIFLALSPMCFAIDSETSLNEANDFFDRGQYEEALLVYQFLLEKKQSSLLLFNIANTLFKLHRLENAQLIYEELITNASNRNLKAKAAHNLGNTYYRQGLFKRAAEAYRVALALDEASVLSRQNLEYMISEHHDIEGIKKTIIRIHLKTLWINCLHQINRRKILTR